jgi:hypothetical protein
MLNIVVCLYLNCQRTHGAIAPSTKLKAKSWKLSCIKSFQLWAFIFERLASGNEARFRRHSPFHLKRETLFCSFYNRTVTNTVGLGGGERVRTDDLLRARQALSQLSYTPNRIYDVIATIENLFFQFNFQLSLIDRLVGLDGVEPSTSRLSGVRSNQTELQAPGNFGSQIVD